MAELVRVMGYKKFKLSQSDVTAILALYIPYAEVHTLDPSTESLAHTPQCRDPKDQIFLDLAHSAQVNYLVTGDADLLVLDDPQLQHISFSICTPLNFLTRLETSL